MGGGVREVHIISRSGKSGEGLQAKVTFNKPAEGGKACIAKFHGVEADGTIPSLPLVTTGRIISVEYDYPEKQDQSTSFLNRRTAAGQSVPSGPSNSNNRGQRRNQRGEQQNNAPAPATTPVYPGVIDGTQGFVPQLYSDVMLIRSGQTKR
jgi:hypothetical protein